MYDDDGYNKIDEKAVYLGDKYPEFWDRFSRMDNSGWLGTSGDYGWEDWCKEKHYNILRQLMSEYEKKEAEEEEEKQMKLHWEELDEKVKEIEKEFPDFLKKVEENNYWGELNEQNKELYYMELEWQIGKYEETKHVN
jgi:hypothetical protein